MEQMVKMLMQQYGMSEVEARAAAAQLIMTGSAPLPSAPEPKTPPPPTNPMEERIAAIKAARSSDPKLYYAKLDEERRQYQEKKAEAAKAKPGREPRLPENDLVRWFEGLGGERKLARQKKQLDEEHKLYQEHLKTTERL